MESNLKDEKSPLLQKATLRDEHGYVILPRTVSSAITIDDLSVTSHLRDPLKPHTLNDLLSTYSNLIGAASGLNVKLEGKADKVHTHDEYMTAERVQQAIANAKLDKLNVDLSTSFDKKVDKIAGKGLSTNDLTNELYDKLVNLSADNVTETHDRLFMTPIERVKLARLDNGGKYRISYNDLLDVPEGIENLTKENIDALKNLDLSNYATKSELSNVKAIAESKANIEHTHDNYTTENKVTELINTLRPTQDMSKYITVELLTQLLNTKSDKDHNHDAIYATPTKVTELINNAIDNLNISGLDEYAKKNDVASALNNKVDKEVGKGLSTEDFTTAEKNKLHNLENYIHPLTHNVSEIRGLASVAVSGSYTDLSNRPYITSREEIVALIAEAQLNGGNVDTSTFQSTTSNELNTNSKSIVGSINEVFNLAQTIDEELDGKSNVSHTHTIEQITNMPTKLSQFTNDLDILDANVTELSGLNTTSKTIVGAINEVRLNAGLSFESDGNNITITMPDLTTEQYNELNGRVTTLTSRLVILENTSARIEQTEAVTLNNVSTEDYNTLVDSISDLERRVATLDSVSVKVEGAEYTPIILESAVGNIIYAQLYNRLNNIEVIIDKLEKTSLRLENVTV